MPCKAHTARKMAHCRGLESTRYALGTSEEVPYNSSRPSPLAPRLSPLASRLSRCIIDL